MIKDHIAAKIRDALKKIGCEVTVVEIEEPVNRAFGDYSTSVALRLAKTIKQQPLVIAQKIAEEILADKYIHKAEAVKPGFVNFWLTKDYLLKQTKDIVLKKTEYGKTSVYENKKILIEFTDPNPFKEFHIGHLYSNTVGESLARLYQTLSADIKRANYQGDVGMHVAKSIWGLKKQMKEDGLSLADIEKKELNEKIKYLGKSYALGATLYETDQQAKDEITQLNKKIYDKNPEITDIYEKGRRWSLEYFEKIYDRLGMKAVHGGKHFDFYYFESLVGGKGLDLVKTFIPKGIFEKSQGAIIFPGEKYGLHTRVFINSLGLPTYEAKELGLAIKKSEDFDYDQSIVVTGNEINGYFKVLLKSLSLIRPDLAAKTVHIGHGMVKLPEGKMSSRTGKIITGLSLIEQTKKEVMKIIEKSKKIDLKDREAIAEKVTVGAIKYSLLKNGIGHDVIFDMKETLSLEGNSGPYLQYTYARCQSVLRNCQFDYNLNPDDIGFLEAEEVSLLRALAKYPDTVCLAGNNLSPHLICNYLYDLSQKFNYFYQKLPIIKTEKQTKRLRLLLTTATAQVVKNGLFLLGIETVDRM